MNIFNYDDNYNESGNYDEDEAVTMINTMMMMMYYVINTVLT